MTEIKVNTENMRTTANAFQDKIDEWKGLVNQLWSLTATQASWRRTAR